MSAVHPESVKERARELRAEGLSYPAITAMTGLPHATVVRWCNEAYAERQRQKSRALKKRYGGVCARCGAKTSHGNASNPAPAKHCQRCAKAVRSEDAFWTRERVLAAARAWARIHGRAPSAPEWSRADRGFPHPAARVCYGHGNVGRREGWRTWNDFIRAAGLEPRGQGQRITRTPEAVTSEAVPATREMEP